MATYRQIIEGLQIFASLEGEGLDDEYNIQAEHDEIFAGPGIDFISPEARNKLKELGWLYDDMIDRYSIYT